MYCPAVLQVTVIVEGVLMVVVGVSMILLKTSLAIVWTTVFVAETSVIMFGVSIILVGLAGIVVESSLFVGVGGGEGVHDTDDGLSHTLRDESQCKPGAHWFSIGLSPESHW